MNSDLVLAYHQNRRVFLVLLALLGMTLAAVANLVQNDLDVDCENKDTYIIGADGRRIVGATGAWLVGPAEHGECSLKINGRRLLTISLPPDGWLPGPRRLRAEFPFRG